MTPKWVDTIRWRLLAGMLALVLGLVVTALVGSGVLRQLRAVLAEDLQALRVSAEVGSGLAAAVFDEVWAAEQYLAAPSAEAEAQFRGAADAAFAYQGRLEALPGLTTDERRLVSRLKDLQAQIQVDFALAHALKDVGREAEAMARAAVVRAPAADLARIVRELSRRQAEQAGVVAARLADRAADRELLLLLTVGIALVVGGVIVVFTLRFVEDPLGRLVTAAERFGAGDLRPVTTGRMPAEFTVLADTLRSMGERLRTIVGEVTGEAERIAGSAGDLSAVSEELAASGAEVSTAMMEMAKGAEEQRGELAAMEAGLASLRQVTSETSEGAEHMARVGETIRQVAERHRGDIATAGTALLDVREVVRTTSAQVTQLAEQSASVDDFVELIKRLSSQTNLLALNAAIEAARAGEHGKGFAVVAEEVRQLADESARAAAEVAQTTAVIREQVQDVTATMAAGQAKVRGIESVAEGAARGLAEIVAAVKEVTTAAARLARAAATARQETEQVAARAQLVASRAVALASVAEQVTAAAEEQGASTEEMAAATGGLLQAAEKLRSLMHGFRV